MGYRRRRSLGPRRARSGGTVRRTGDRVLLADAELSVEAGELVCLLGANGSGKTTLLRTLVGLHPPLAGTVRLLNRDLAGIPPGERARLLAVVLTDAVDAGILTGRDLVALGRYPHTDWTGRLRPVDHEAVGWALAATGAEALGERNVAELSDGERQRVMIARALAQRPAVLALDEPVAFVDLPRRLELVSLLRDLARECGLAVVLTAHDLDLALRTADTVWLLAPGSGDRATLSVGAPEDLALGGAIAAAFPADDIAFDLASGTFRSRRPAPFSVLVTGAEPAVTWTRRAVERQGMAVAMAGERGDLAIQVEQDPRRWTVTSAAGVSQHGSLAGVAAALRRLGPRVLDERRSRQH